MKVKELISKLQDEDQEAEVRLQIKTEDGFYDVPSKYSVAFAKDIEPLPSKKPVVQIYA